MTTTEVERQRKMLNNIPQEHRKTDDTRLEWLWNQRLIVVQWIYTNTDSARDKMAASLVLLAAWSANLPSIEQLLRRLEGGSVPDEKLQEDDSMPI
jgi:hypothetical protein